MESVVDKVTFITHFYGFQYIGKHFRHNVFSPTDFSKI